MNTIELYYRVHHFKFRRIIILFYHHISDCNNHFVMASSQRTEADQAYKENLTEFLDQRERDQANRGALLTNFNWVNWSPIIVAPLLPLSR